MVGGRANLRSDQGRNTIFADHASDFQAFQAVVVGARCEGDGTVSRCSCEDEFGENVLGATAVKVGPAGQGPNARIARSQTRALGRKFAVGGTGADSNPMCGIARFLGKREVSGKRSTSLQRDRIAAIRAVQGGLEIPTGSDRDDFSVSGRIGQSRLQIEAW